MNFCFFASMIACIASYISQFSRKIENTSRFVLDRMSLNQISGLSFLRSLAVILIAVMAWSGVQVQEVEYTGVVGYGVSEVRLGEGVWAATPEKPKANATTPDGTTGVKTINAALNVMYALLTPLLMLAGWLLTPDWVFGEIFGLRPVLHDLWILISNIVYIIFAFLLVAMAFMNIFGHEGNTWAIRAKLPRLIIGVVSVPFTWLFVSAVVSLSSVLTASAVQIAGDLAPSNVSQFNFPMPGSCTLDFTQSANGTATGSKFLDCKPATAEKKFSDLFKSDDAFGIVSYYAYGVFKIDKYKEITGKNLWSIKDALNLSVNLLIALIMFVWFFLIIVALVFALFSRALYFWAISVFSPLLSLRYFFEGKLGGFGDKWLSVSSIIGLAMVPVYVAAALSFGLIFTSAVTTTKLAGTESNYVKDIKQWASDKEQLMTIMGTEYKIIGVPVGTTLGDDLKTLGGGFIWQLIIQLAALWILWFAVMAALKGSEVTKEAAEPIASFGADIGKLMQSLPKYAPIIPTGHGAASLASLPRISNQVKNAADSTQTTRAQEVGNSITNALGFNNAASKKLQDGNTLIARTIAAQNKSENIQKLEQFAGATKLDANEFNTPATKSLLQKFVTERTHGTAEEKKHVNEAIDKLNGSDESFKHFLEAYESKLGDGKWTLNELQEYRKAINSPATTTSALTTQTTNVVNVPINIGGASIPMNFTKSSTGQATWLESWTIDLLKTKIADLKATNPPNITEQLDAIRKEFSLALEKNNLTGEEINSKLRIDIGLDPKKTP